MSLFGSLFTGVSALAAQSQSMAMISNNIANVNTTGFKRSEAAFYSLVTTETRAARYSPGTVSVNRQQRVDEQGPVQQTNSSTDVAISGNGFFVVRRGNEFGQEYLYTRNGSFSEDSQGFLRNTAGFYLYGWPLDNEANLPAAQGDLTSLVPVDVAFLGGLTRPTSQGTLGLNLNADETNYFDDLPVENRPAHFTRGLRVYDTLGAPQDVQFEFRKTIGPMSNARADATNLNLTTDIINSTATLQGVNQGDSFSVQVGAGPVLDIEFDAVAPDPTAVPPRVQTIQQLLDVLNGYDTGNILEARLVNNRLVVQARNTNEDITLTETNGTPLFGVDSFEFPGAGPAETYTPLNLAGTYPGQANFPAFDNGLNPNTQGWWEVTINNSDGGQLSQGLLNFNGDGTLNAAPDADNLTRIILQDIDWGNGSDPQTIDLMVDRFTQFSGNYNVVSAEQNGAELGLRTSIEIDRDGFVIARFSNGAQSRLYKLPLATFANPNGLNEVSGTAYSKNNESGEENLREAGRGGAGFLESSTIESSNVDLADEFARMIITQRAYSAGTKVINTADQMTEELLRMR